MFNFCVIFTNSGISRLSLDFFEAKYGQIYDQKCVKSEKILIF